LAAIRTIEGEPIGSIWVRVIVGDMNGVPLRNEPCTRLPAAASDSRCSYFT
jgi:hypothetical protein